MELTAAKKSVAKAAPKKVAPKKASTAKTNGVTRRDASGHLDPKYAAKLRAAGGHEDSNEDAFFRKSRAHDSLAEELGESVVRAATSGEDDETETLSADVIEEEGGPFVPSTAGQEFADGTDESNPKGANREPFPRT